MQVLSKLTFLHLHIQDFEMRTVKKNIKTEKGRKRKRRRERPKCIHLLLYIMPWDKCFIFIIS